MRRTILAAIAAAALSTGALAQSHAHGDQGPHGGKMQDVVGVHAELLTAERTLTVHLYDESPLPRPATRPRPWSVPASRVRSSSWRRVRRTR